MTIFVQTILEVVARQCEITSAELISTRRHKTLVEARMVVAYLAKHHTSLSYLAIAKQLGDRDHSSIWHLAKQAQQKLESDSIFKDKVNCCEAEILSRFVQISIPQTNDTTQLISVINQLVIRLEKEQADLETAKTALASKTDLADAVKKQSLPVACPHKTQLATELASATIELAQSLHSNGERYAVERLKKAKIALLDHYLPVKSKPNKELSREHHIN
jgi:hypothetical protein